MELWNVTWTQGMEEFAPFHFAALSFSETSEGMLSATLIFIFKPALDLVTLKCPNGHSCRVHGFGEAGRSPNEIFVSFARVRRWVDVGACPVT